MNQCGELESSLIGGALRLNQQKFTAKNWTSDEFTSQELPGEDFTYSLAKFINYFSYLQYTIKNRNYTNFFV